MPSELQEALTSTGAAALINKIISPLLLEYQRRYSPFYRALPSEKWASNVYNWNTRTVMPRGGPVTDGGARPVVNSTYSQSPVTLRNFQVVGAVTGYAQEVTRQLVGDLQRREIEGALQSLIWSIESDLDWGNAAASGIGPYPTFDGLDTLASSFSGGAFTNAFDVAGATLATRHLDVLIDAVQQNATMPIIGEQWMFVASSTAQSKLAQLIVGNQRYNGDAPMVQVAPGLNAPSWRGVPIVLSSFLGSRGFSMPTVSTSTGSGGSLPATERFYVVTAVYAQMGESLPCAEVNATPSASGTVTLSWTPATGFEGATPDFYKVYESATTGTETLLGIVPGYVNLAADGITPVQTTSVIDDGVTLKPRNSATTPIGGDTAAYVGGNTGMKPRSAGGEDIYLISRDPNFVVRPYVREIQPVNLAATVLQPDALPFALVSDTALALRAPKYMARLRNVVSTL